MLWMVAPALPKCPEGHERADEGADIEAEAKQTMLTENLEGVKQRGEALKKGVGNAAELIEGESEVGGGSFPGAKLPTWLVRLTADRLTADGLASRLRSSEPPVIARIADGRVVLDARTIFPNQVEAAARAVAAALTADS